MFFISVSFFNLFVKGFSDVLYSFKYTDYLYDHYFRFSIRHNITYLSPFCLGFLLWFCLVLSLGTYSSFSSFYLTFCVCFYALRKSATLPILESSGLLMSRSAPQCSITCLPECGTRGVSYVCCMYPATVAKPRFPLVQLSAVALLAYCGQFLIPVDQSGPPWAWVEADQAFTRDAIAANCRALSLRCPLKSFWW